jgi:hypothetical protein
MSPTTLSSSDPSSSDTDITTTFIPLYQDPLSDESSTSHSPATHKDIKCTSYNTRTSNKQRSNQKQFNDVSSLDYSSSSSLDIIQKQLRPTTMIHPTTNAQIRATKMNKISSEWATIFSGRRSGTTMTSRLRTQPKRWNQSTISTTMSFQAENTPFGDNIETFLDAECFLFHNINGIKDGTNWVQINKTMQELDITCFGFSEINTTFRGSAYQKWNNSITRETFRRSKVITSESDIRYEHEYKPGGTLTAIIGKWQSRISEKGTDPSGLGRWSYFRISSNKRNLIVVTAYKPLKTQGPAVDDATGSKQEPRPRQILL